MTSVPFENLDIHLGRTIDLRLDTLFDKIVNRRRGGFCYELNGLFAWLLEALGFDVTMLSAQDIKDDGTVGPPYDHLVLRVTCPADREEPSAPWLVDVGWGDSFTVPLRLDWLDEQSERLRAYRIDDGGDYRLLWQCGYGGQWSSLYRFTLTNRQLNDFERTCLYHQTSPKSAFTQHRICSMATPTGRISLDDHRLIVTENGERQEQTVDTGVYRTILREQFGVNLGAHERWVSPDSSV